MTLRLLLAPVFLLLAAATALAAPPPALVPLPARVVAAPGGFTVDAATPIVVGDAGAATRVTAAWLHDHLARSRGLDLQVRAGGAATRGAIVLERDPRAPVAAREGYALDVTPGGIAVRARDDAGMFYGAVTLWQLLTPDPRTGAVTLGAVTIHDQPRFAWRGLMLDSARHFQSVADVEALLDAMAGLKLNTLHWHLTDDQGWRIEIKRYPELTRIGAWRTPPDAGHDGEPVQYGGYYTQDEIRRVVAYAAARHIDIVPELDMPGHAQAAVASYPALGVTGQRPAVSVDWGVNPFLYNVDGATFTFLDHVLDEVMALFPSRYIHVGGDEAIKDQWQASKAVQARMHALGLKDEDALQGWFIGRIGRYLAAHGRHLVGWDEILAGGVPKDATVMSWRGSQGAVEAARRGHDVVLSPAPDLYLDELQGSGPDEDAGRMPVKDLASVYAFEPVPAGLDARQARHVLGAQANAWTEHMPTFRHVERAMFPRAAALAEVDWSPAATRDWAGFVARLPAQFARWRNRGVAFADSALAPDIRIDGDAALASGQTTLTLDNQAQAGAIHYTLDGTTPTAQSPRYTGPVPVRLPLTVQAATFDAAGDVLAATRRRVLDRTALLARDGNALANCPGSDFRLRVQPMPDATSLQPVYSVNLFDSCQMFPALPQDGARAIHVDAVRLERNYALAHDAKLVVSRPQRTPHGELDVHLDTCDGALLASMPLPDPQTSPRRFTLDAALPATTGTHALCLIYTAATDGPLYALAEVSLLPAPPPR